MKAKHLKPGRTIRYKDEIVHVTAVNKGVNVRIDGTVWLKPGREEVTHFLAPDTDAPLCTFDGVLTEGKTKAQIRAESVVASLAVYGIAAELEVKEEYGAVWAYVTLPSEHGVLSDRYHGGWYTRTEGRKTTGFRGFTIRGIYRGRKRSTAKLTEQQFHQEVGMRISMAQYRMRKEAEEANAG